MRTKFITNDFELDVSHLELSWTEENTWFKDEFFLISSFPFEMDYFEIPYFQFFKHKNLPIINPVFQGQLEKDGRIEDAILEVEEAGTKLRLTIRYGVEALSNWTKKISELELLVVLPEGGDMIAHANTLISKTYPETFYNFPAIHSEYYKDAAMFNSFEGIINKRVSGDFIQNIIDGAETKNKNIVYPFPYFLFVLESAIADAGYMLHGDVLEDSDLLDAIIFSGKKIVEFDGIPKPVDYYVGQTDRISKERKGHFNWLEKWFNETEVNFRGSFQLSGEINDEVKTLQIKLNGDVIFSYNKGDGYFFNFWFSTSSETNTLVCEATSLGNGLDTFVIDGKLRTLHLLDEFGEIVPFFANFSNIQLADKLPDVTVGDLFKFLKRLKNYDLDIRNGNEIWINLVQNEVINSEIEDISDLEVKELTRKFEQSKSFVLKYEGEYDDYQFTQVYADENGFIINDFEKKENTTEITINGIPLPLIEVDGIRTAVQITDSTDKIMLVKFPGLTENENWTQPQPNLDCYQLWLNYHKNWLNFMIHSIPFNWLIRSTPNNLMRIKRKSKLFCFNNLLFVHVLNRRRKKDIEEIEIEAYSSKV